MNASRALSAYAMRPCPPALPAPREHPILSIGRDEPLLASRAGVLNLLGRKIVSVPPREAFDLLQEDRPFSLIVLGHTLTPGEISTFSALARKQRPAPCLLMIYVRLRPAELDEKVDAQVESLDGPAELLRRSSLLLGLDPTVICPRKGVSAAPQS